MQNWWIGYKMAQIRQAEILKEAARIRTAQRTRRQSRESRTPRTGDSRRSLLARWARALQKRRDFRLQAFD